MQDIASITQWTPRFTEPWLPWSRHRPGHYVDAIMRELAFEAHLKKLYEEAKQERARHVSKRGRVTVVS